MTRRWLEQAIEQDYLPAIRALDDTPEGHQAAEELCDSIRQSWQDRIALRRSRSGQADRGSKALTQQQGLMDQTRKTLKAKLGEDHWVLNYIRFSQDESIEINNIKQNRIAVRNESVQQLDRPDEIVATAVRLLESPEWANLAAGLAVLTGRRVAELLSTAEFEKKTQWSVIFTGALKRRGEPVTLSFEIPTLTTADRVIKALEKLRFELPEATKLTPEEINKRYEKQVADACDNAFADLVPTREGKATLYTHLFRAVYATIATFWYCPPSVNEVEFKATIQGHYLILDEKNPQRRRSLAAERHYSDYEISDREIAHYKGKRKGIKLGVSNIEPIEEFQAAWKKGMEPKAPREKKDRSSYRIWKADKQRLDRILEPFQSAGTHQSDRFHAFLDWFESQQHRLTLPQAESTEAELIPTEATPTEDISMQTQAAPEPIQLAQSELDEDLTPDAPPAASTTDSKIDQLIDTMNRFIEMQMALAMTSSQPAQPAQSVKPARSTRPKSVPATSNGSIAPAIRAATQRQAIALGEADHTPEPDGEGKASIEKPTRTLQTRAGAEETAQRINQAIDAIMAYNDTPNRRHDEKWAIGINALKAFVKSQEAIVQAIGGRNRKQEEVVGTRQAEIEQHHAKHQIDPDKHNYKHRGKQTIDQVITLD